MHDVSATPVFPRSAMFFLDLMSNTIIKQIAVPGHLSDCPEVRMRK